VAFWFGPPAVFAKGATAVPELVQVLSVGVTVQTNCADAGWLTTVTKNKQERKTDGSVSHEPRGRCSHHMTTSPQKAHDKSISLRSKYLWQICHI
jgi:hypothetical protein